MNAEKTTGLTPLAISILSLQIFVAVLIDLARLTARVSGLPAAGQSIILFGCLTLAHFVRHMLFAEAPFSHAAPLFERESKPSPLIFCGALIETGEELSAQRKAIDWVLRWQSQLVVRIGAGMITSFLIYAAIRRWIILDIPTLLLAASVTLLLPAATHNHLMISLAATIGSLFALTLQNPDSLATTWGGLIAAWMVFATFRIYVGAEDHASQGKEPRRAAPEIFLRAYRETAKTALLFAIAVWLGALVIPFYSKPPALPGAQVNGDGGFPAGAKPSFSERVNRKLGEEFGASAEKLTEKVPLLKKLVETQASTLNADSEKLSPSPLKPDDKNLNLGQGAPNFDGKAGGRQVEALDPNGNGVLPTPSADEIAKAMRAIETAGAQASAKGSAKGDINGGMTGKEDAGNGTSNKNPGKLNANPGETPADNLKETPDKPNDKSKEKSNDAPDEKPPEPRPLVKPEVLDKILAVLRAVAILSAVVAVFRLLRQALSGPKKTEPTRRPKIPKGVRARLLHELETLPRAATLNALDARRQLEVLYRIFCSAFETIGAPRADHEPPHDYALDLMREFPPLAVPVQTVTTTFSDSYYGEQAVPNAQVQTTQDAVHQILRELS